VKLIDAARSASEAFDRAARSVHIFGDSVSIEMACRTANKLLHALGDLSTIRVSTHRYSVRCWRERDGAKAVEIRYRWT